MVFKKDILNSYYVFGLIVFIIIPNLVVMFTITYFLLILIVF